MTLLMDIPIPGETLRQLTIPEEGILRALA